jgi:putative endonuclease
MTKPKFCIYVLESLTDGSHYVGSTGKDLEHRLERHNRGEYRFTKGRIPWIVIHEESFPSRSEAVKRERFLKTGIGRQELKTILKNLK